jgi:hypothetical protein
MGNQSIEFLISACYSEYALAIDIKSKYILETNHQMGLVEIGDNKRILKEAVNGS